MAMIATIHGEMDESLLRRVDGVLDNDHEHTTWVEYWRGEELVHRSVHVTLKEWPDGMTGIAETFGGKP
jgi:hypothetical protein